MSPKTRTGVDVYVDGSLRWRKATVTFQFGTLVVRHGDDGEVLRLTDAEQQPRKKSNAWTWKGAEPGAAAEGDGGGVAVLAEPKVVEVTAIQPGGCGCGKR